MDVSGIAKVATAITETGTLQEVDIAILKRAQQIESATATQLIDSLPAPYFFNDNVCNLIYTTA